MLRALTVIVKPTSCIVHHLIDPAIAVVLLPEASWVPALATAEQAPEGGGACGLPERPSSIYDTIYDQLVILNLSTPYN